MIYIVIPVYNRKEFTRECLLSLRKQTYQDFKVVVTDDGSTDGTDQMLADEFPEVEVIKVTGGLFWTAATNLGIELALERGTDYVLTLNNDTIASENYLEKMYEWAQKKPNALLGSYALDSKTQQPVYGGEFLNWRTNQVKSLLQKLRPEEQVGLHEVSYFPGRGLLIPVAVFEKVGLFNQKTFPHYFADYDFTQQSIKHGFKVYCNYDAKLYTYPEESGDRQNRRRKTFKNYYNHLLGIKGGGNLRNFTNFVFRNCPPQYIPYVLLNGYIRRIFGYFIR